jgi:hypothetical protein
MKHLILLLSLLFLSCSPKPISLLIIGDSISSDCAGGYPGYIRELRPDWKVDVLAYPGKSSGDIEREVSQSNIDYPKYSHMIVMVGMNDHCDRMWTVEAITTLLLQWKNKEHLKKYVMMYPPGPWCSSTNAYNLIYVPELHILTTPKYTSLRLRMMSVLEDYNPIRYIENGYRGKVKFGSFDQPGTQRIGMIDLIFKPGVDAFWQDGLHIKPAGNLEIAKQIVERIEQEKQ